MIRVTVVHYRAQSVRHYAVYAVAAAAASTSSNDDGCQR